MSVTPVELRWLDAAARQATPFIGTTGALPTIGAIIVDPATQTVIGRGVTAPDGNPGAETLAVEDARRAAHGATLYLTLEPADRNPSPVEPILEGRIARIVSGLTEPDRAAAGRARERLQASGIETLVIDHAGSRQLHEGHLSRVERSRPFVTARLMVSSDGKAGIAGQGNALLPGELAMRWTMMQRARSDAILVGWNTARLDDPLLDVSLPGLDTRQPLRVILAGFRTHRPQMRLLGGANPALVVAIPEKKLTLPDKVPVLHVKGIGSRPNPMQVLTALAQRGVQNLLLETGPTLLDVFLEAGLVDRFHLLTSETVLGPAALPPSPRGAIASRLGALGFSLVDHRPLGADNLRTFERALLP